MLRLSGELMESAFEKYLEAVFDRTTRRIINLHDSADRV